MRIGAVGCGQFMSQQHIQTVARSDRLVLQHLADIDPGRLSRIAARHRPIRQSTRWEDVIDDPEVDTVVIGVLPSLHPRITRAALKKGKPVYVEKPLAPTAAECLEVDRLARAAGLPVAVGFNRRFAPATVAMATVFGATDAPVSLYYRIADDDRIRPPEQKWKTTDRLLTETVHIFDLLAFLLGADPVEVYARESRPNDALVTIDFANGSRATILSSSHGSLAQPKEHLEAVLGNGVFIEMDDYVEIRTYGLPDQPAVQTFPGRAYDGCDNRHVDDFARRGLGALIEHRLRYETAMRESGVLADSADAGAWAVARQKLGDPPPPQINYAPDKGWGTALESFFLAVASGRPPTNANARDGIRATTCAVAARKSILTGRPIRLKPTQWSG
jgi:myo-inositol 2-dehydrogenase/D-chiro-inositol 1-dehydrogenase